MGSRLVGSIATSESQTKFTPRCNCNQPWVFRTELSTVRLLILRFRQDIPASGTYEMVYVEKDGR